MVNNKLKVIYTVLLFCNLALVQLSCRNSTEPDVSNELRLILSADKTSGISPLTINFSGNIQGNTEGLSGHLPDYVFFIKPGKTIIRYAIPDTSLSLVPSWKREEIFYKGEHKAVLLYQGIKDGKNIDIFSDTIRISVQ